MTFIQIKEIRMSQKIKSNITLGHNLRSQASKRKKDHPGANGSQNAASRNKHFKKHLFSDRMRHLQYKSNRAGCSENDSGCGL